MDIYAQNNIINDISFELDKFKKIGNNFNFRCPYCGDSSKNKYKVRGNLFLIEDRYVYHCYNCDISVSLLTFLKDHFPNHYYDFIFQKYKNKDKIIEIDKRLKIVPPKNNKINLPYISELSSNHNARRYLLLRKIPKYFFDYFYYAEKFNEFVNSLLGYEKLNPNFDSPRIIIPFYNKKKELFGLQGRSIVPSSAKYITVMLKERSKVFGLDRLNLNKRIWVTEGPFDSLFIDNSIAICGSNLFSFDDKNLDVVYVFDNELTTNKQIMKKMNHLIKLNKSVVIWPSYIKEKDINDMVISGLDVKEILLNNVYRGLMARLQISSIL